MSSSEFRVLFLCTGNSARSIMAETLLNQLGKGRFEAFSAGSHPTGHVHVLALELLRKHGQPIASLRSKNWDEFARPEIAPMDFIITLCDKSAGEDCPAWPGRPVTAHWGFEDPAAHAGPLDAQQRAFERTYRELAMRIQAFLSLPLEKLDRLALQQQVRNLGNPE